MIRFTLFDDKLNLFKDLMKILPVVGYLIELVDNF